ncbi:RNA-directed DNA polymerase [Xanthobacter autotrophicus]|uniref:RNA-directed DNA polymerase n=1 Tax=Xanthobacter autotrophicus TaxID=280 RepID=UPI0037268C7E
MIKPIRLTRSQRLRRFLEVGYLAEELPPPFVSHSIARFRQALLRDWSAEATYATFRSRPEQFTIPRYGAARRRVTIPNPINFYRLSAVISNGWVEIRDHISKSKITEFRPILDAEGPRAVFKLDFGIIDKRTAEILSDYDYAFKTDITRFYHSIYTHSIAWALYGKDWVKKNRNQKSFKESLGNLLDLELRKGQEDQSVGMPIGPDTSRILSEVVAVGLERELQPLLPNLDRRSIRYVDDILIGFDEGENDDQVAAALEAAMSHYELDINVSKTRTLGKRGVECIEWVSELRACRVRLRSAENQRGDLERFFTLALFYADQNEKDAVLKWAMKRARSFKLNNVNSNLYFDYMIRCARKSLSTLPILAQSLIEAHSNSVPIPLDRVEKLVRDTIRVHSRVGHAFEVSWSLLIAKGLRIRLRREQLTDVFKLESSPCALLCMDLNARGLIEGGIDEAAWLPYGTADGLASPMWLLAYEAARKGWWSDGRRDYVRNHPLFGPMLRRGVFFYDEKRNVPRLRKELKEAKTQRIRAGLILSNWLDYL